MRRICFVLPSLAGGGAERAAVQILNGLDERTWERWIYLFRREGPYLGDIAASVQLASGFSDSRAGRWRALRRFIRATRPDLAVAFLSHLSILTAVRTAGVGTKVVLNLQTPVSAFLADGDYPWKTRPLYRRAFKAITRTGYRAADCVVTTSRGVADDLIDGFGIPAGQVRVVHNPFDLDAIAEASHEPLPPAHQALWIHPVVVAAGRLAEVKNFSLLIESMGILRRRVPARLFILGEGEQESRLRELIAEKGLGDAVHLCGFQKNPWKYFARADVFALTSHYEGFGNVLVEAMASGIPVVATSSPGTREIVAAGVDGILVDKHTPASFAGALADILGDEVKRSRMATAARQATARFGVRTIAMKYDSLFAEMLA